MNTPLGIPLWNRHLGTQIMLIDPEDYAALPPHHIWLGSDGYVSIYLRKPHPYLVTTLSRYIMRPCPDPSLVVDHINQTPLDNRRSNLRWLSRTHNMLNSDKFVPRSKTGVMGVYSPAAYEHTAKPYAASISRKLKTIHLGRFATIEEAAAARRDAEVHYWGREWVA